MCKHLLAILDRIAADPARLALAQAARDLETFRHRLLWNPVRPSLGLGDWLERVQLVDRNGNGTTAMPSVRRRFHDAGDGCFVLHDTHASEPAQRLQLIEELAAIANGGTARRLAADPAARALLQGGQTLRLQRATHTAAIARRAAPCAR